MKITEALEEFSVPVASDGGERMKRLADIIIAFALLSLTFPLMTFVAFAIKFEGPGPILEQQKRRSSDGCRFTLLTFRTTQYDFENARSVGARQPTRVGQVLRFTRIDALPQLVNLLRGEISVTEAIASPNTFWD